jgi:pilus assembly protein CpaE
MPPSAPGKIRVIIVDDIPETRDNIKKLLFFEKDIEIIGTASNGREGVELALRSQPDVALMDINMPEMDGIAASEIISSQAPHIQVVMMSVQGEADYLRRSMLAGAREFLIKPFSGDELVTSIHRVHQLATTRRAAAPPVAASEGNVPVAPPPPPPKGGMVIAVFGSKGGCGSSTVAANLALALREETKERVALVDANFEFGDLGVLFNLPSTRTIADLTADKVTLDDELLDGTLASHSSGVKVLLSPPRPELAELVTTDHIRRILEMLGKHFDYIIVDLWKSFQKESTVVLMDAADKIVLVSTTEIPAIKNAKSFFELTDQLGYPKDKVYFILNKEDGRSGIGVKEIEASIKHVVGLAIPRDDRTTTIALQRGTPFVIMQRNIPLSQAFFVMAKALKKQPAEKETAPIGKRR